MARDKLAEIAERRARSKRAGWWRGERELDDLERQWQGGQGQIGIPAEFVAIRLVTILEVFTRDWVAELVDVGDPYTGRGADLVKGSLKIDYAMAQALVGMRVTFGELISHEISVNGIGDIDRAFSTLLGGSLFAKLEGFTDRWATGDNCGPIAPILPDPELARAQMGRLFAARHIIVHELPDNRGVGSDEISDFVRATVSFLKAGHQYLDRLVHGDYPVTQMGMTAAAIEKADQADAELRGILEQLDPGGSDVRLIAAQAAWEDYRQKEAEYRSGHFEGGSIAPMLFADEMEKVTRVRIEQLHWYLHREEGDM